MCARFAWMGTGVALAAALGVVVMGSRGDAPRQATPSVATPPSATAPDLSARTADTVYVEAVVDTAGGRAAIAAQTQRERFEKALRDFLANAQTLGAAERARIAGELDAQVEAEELAQRMSADEARMLRLALIERSTDDADERLRRSEALADAYRREAERRQRAFEQGQVRDPRFRDYKAREAQVVREVMALREIPGGLSRDAYLRQRLQAERERAYGGG